MSGDYKRKAVSTSILTLLCERKSPVADCGSDFRERRTFNCGLPAAHNKRDRITVASGGCLPETSKVCCGLSHAQNSLLRIFQTCWVRLEGRHSTARVGGCRGSQSNSPARKASPMNPRRGDNRVRLERYSRVTGGGRNRDRGFRGVGVECSCGVRFRGGRGPFSMGMRASSVKEWQHTWIGLW